MSWCRIWSKPGMLSSMESTRTSRDHYEGNVVFGVEMYYGHRSYAIEIAFSCYLCLQFNLHPSSFICVLSQNFWYFKRPQRMTSFTAMYIYKKRDRVSIRFARVTRVSPGQLLGGFLLRPGPVLGRVGFYFC
jgi:hypothetical protein